MAKITLFGLAGTGTSSVGKKLAETLGYEYRSPSSLFRKKAEELGLDIHEFGTLCEKDPQYDKMLDRDIEEFGRSADNFVVESRLAWHFIPDSFKIKLVCDTEERMHRVARRDKLSLDEAREKTTMRERADEKRYAEYYGITKLAPAEAFDLILDSTNQSVDEIISIICAKIKV